MKSILPLLTLLLPVICAQETEKQGVDLHLGPVYTNASPKLDIVLETSAGNQGSIKFRAEELFLTEDGVRTKNATGLQQFRSMDRGMAVVLAIDASGSMRGAPIDAVRQGLAEFVSRARPQDKVAVISFADDARWEAQWDTPPSELRQRLSSVQVRGTRTRLWDTLDRALDELAKPGLPERKRLIVISDGHDEGSRISVLSIIVKAGHLRIPVDSIGMSRDGGRHLENLRLLAHRTAGRYQVAPDVASLRQLVSEGIDHLLDTPVARFRLARVRGDGQSHRIGVFWKASGRGDEVSVLLPKRGPAWLPVWFEWWHGAVAAAALALLAVLSVGRRKPGKILPPPAVAVDYPVPEIPLRKADPAVVHAAQRPSEPLGPLGMRDVQPVPAQRAKTQVAPVYEAPRPDRPMVLLRAQSGPISGSTVPIDRPEFWIGAADNNHLIISDDALSGNHACFRLEGATLKLYDNRSTNNTWVNRQPLGESGRIVFPGDEIQVGQSVFRVDRA